MSETDFDAVLEDQTFTVETLDKRIAELVAGGSGIRLTYARRNEYADAVINFRMHEYDVQVRTR